MVERLTGTDLAELALDVGPQPRVVAAVVELAPPRVTADEVRALLARRAAGSRLLGRRVRRVPPGCGRAVWEPVEPDLDVHVVAASCGDGDRAVLALASRAMTVPMPRARPLWRLVVADRPSGSTALIWVSHHAIGDGPTVLRAVVDALADGPASPGPSAAAPVSELDLARDALVSRVRALSRWRAGLRLLRDAERDLRGGRGLPAAATSFNRAPSGPGMRFVLARISLAAVRDGAATCGATVNDAVLCAVGRALGEELERRGEPARDLVATVAATFRRDRGPAGPRNEVGGMLVPIPTDLHVHATTRLRAVADASREHKRTLSPATPVVMAPVLRAASAAGLGRRFFERQRMVNVAVTTLPGPRELPPMCGREVRALVPLSPIVGNVPVTVVALSSGGELTVSLCLGRDLWRSANALAGAVEAELATIGALAGNRRGSTVVG
jgi:WS/DGAT/MGAT family acyltransferase